MRTSARRASRLACLGLAVTTLASWTVSAATNHVWQGSPNPTPPYDSWETAAHVIQDAVDAALAGDEVSVLTIAACSKKKRWK